MLKDFMINQAPLLYMEPDYHPVEQRVNCVGIRYERDHFVVDCYNVYKHSIVTRRVYKDEQGYYIKGLAGQGIAHFDLESVRDQLRQAFNRFSYWFLNDLETAGEVLHSEDTNE